ncbi:MAG: polysaccharide biosynthesis/export family protein [Hyphomicrobiaceae bacterium]
MDVTTKTLRHSLGAPNNARRHQIENWSVKRLPLRSLTPIRNVLGMSIFCLSVLVLGPLEQVVIGGKKIGMAAAQTAADRTKTITGPIRDATTAGHYAFGVGDTVAVTVIGRTDLNGQFLIGLDGTFRHPFVGAIPAAGRTWENVEGDLKKKLKRLLARDVRLSVDIGVFRPVYVIGDVIRPGEVAYTPGLPTFTAVAKAGGVPSLRQLPPNQIAQIALSERDLRVAEAELAGFLIRRAALDAALSGELKIAIPAELKHNSQSSLIAELLARQTAVLEGERTRIQRLREMTQSEERHLETEIAALAKEQAIIAAQAKTIHTELQKILAASKRGLVTSRRVLDFERFKTGNDQARFRIAAAMSRARQQRVELEKRQRHEEDVLKQERLRQRLAVESDIERARARINGARTALALGSQVAANDPNVSRPEPTFTIIRTTVQGQTVLNANASTPLVPGDVLEVRLVPVTTPPVTVTKD